MSTICTVKKHPDTGLLYTLVDGGAVIVGCTNLHLTHLDIPPVIIEDGRQLFVTAVGESAFAYHPALQTVQLPERLTSIGHGAFEGSALTRVTIPGNVTSIGPYAFYGCPRLGQVDLPTAAALEEEAFGGCDALQPGNVQNLALLPDDARRRAGLPQPSAAGPAVIYVDGQPAAPETQKHPAQKLLEDGMALEAEGSYAMAAAAYMQAHRLRVSVGHMSDMVQQEALMKPIAEAELRLALLLKFGLAPARNPDGTPRPAAAELLTTLVETSGLADAAYHLGDILCGGYGLPVDADRAVTLLKSAADLNHERACLDLGYIYMHGTLAPVSSPTARHYFEKCAALDGPYAAIARDEMRGLLPR